MVRIDSSTLACKYLYEYLYILQPTGGPWCTMRMVRIGLCITLSALVVAFGLPWEGNKQ